MLDQYDNPIPDDLVLLPSYDFLNVAGIDVIFKARWYEAEQILMASAKEIEYLSEDDPLDADVDLSSVIKIMCVADVLKRGNPKDGFYHV